MFEKSFILGVQTFKKISISCSNSYIPIGYAKFRLTSTSMYILIIQVDLRHRDEIPNKDIVDIGNINKLNGFTPDPALNNKTHILKGQVFF